MIEPQNTMKNTLFVIILLVCSYGSYCQSNAITFFEVHTKRAYSPISEAPVSFNKDSIIARIRNTPDSAAMNAKFLVSLNNAGVVDSIFFTLKNSNNQQVLNKGEKLSQLLAGGGAKLLDGTFYYTPGAFSFLKKFLATVRFKYVDGSSSAIRTFDK